MKSQSLRDQGARYILTSGLSAVVSFGLPIALHEFAALPEDRAVLIGLITAFFLNFFTTRLFVFRSAGKSHHDLARFMATTLCFRGAEYLAFTLLASVLHVYYIYALGTVLAASAVTKFVVYRHFVYGIRPRPRQPQRAV